MRTKCHQRKEYLAAVLLTIIIPLSFHCTTRLQTAEQVLEKIAVSRGICVILGDRRCDLAVELAQNSDLLLYVQLPDTMELEAARRAVDAAGFYGTRIYVEKGSYDRIRLADNLADALIALDKNIEISEREALRVVRPRGKVLLRGKELVKTSLDGVDDWSHPYHGPDNNPQSNDQVAKAPYLTQFFANPQYAPLTQVAVASAGRVFKAFGNIAFHEREEPYLNTLVAFNGYNGTMLWKRRLAPGVMIHRNTMIATPDILYVGDDKSCKVIDAVTGRLRDEIIPPPELAGGSFWKWMALEQDVLYALTGDQEQKDPVTRQRRKAHGWPWFPVSKGFNQPTHPWGYGHNLLAIDPKTHKVLWSHREEAPIDSRALGMKNNRIFLFRFGAYLACLDARTGKEVWRKTPDNAPDLFALLGNDQNRQDWRTNWRTTNYLKCSDKALYFAGPQVQKLVAISADDGAMLWEHPYSNFQLILREDGLYGFSGQIDEFKSLKFDPLTGEVLAEMDTRRRGCTRPNGAVDAIFYRAEGGSVRLDLASKRANWISPMRAQCHDGVTIANGLLYWWPMTCDCQNSVMGVTCLGPAGDFDFYQTATTETRLELGDGDFRAVESLPMTPADWPTFRANNRCTATTEAVIRAGGKPLWWYTPPNPVTPTAPVTVGGMVFLSGSDGIVRALDVNTGDLLWKAYTGGAVQYPPTVWQGRLFVGSGDGLVYAYEAKTGRLLWRFHAAPQHRKIPVYGKLLSTWPVASGVMVEDGVAYFAAGIVNYDGTYVYAIDAISGEIKWQNNTSGHLDREARTGASVHGHLLIDDGKLYMPAGTTFSPAVYDIATGECLNDPEPLKSCASNCSRGCELYQIGEKVIVSGKPLYAHPEYPVYDVTVTNKLLHTSVVNRDIVLRNNRILGCYQPIDKKSLHACVTDPGDKAVFMNRGWGQFDIPDKPIWEYDCEETFAIGVCQNAVALMRTTPSGDHRVQVVDLKSGQLMAGYRSGLVGPPLPWGMAVDRDGRVIVAATDGQLLCMGVAE